MQERLQKIIARAGIASRRHAEELIKSGLVTVNGKTVTELGSKADGNTDHIKVSGKLLRPETERVYMILNKPPEVVSTMSDPEGRRALSDLLQGVSQRVFPVGRLEYHSMGLVFLTNDGELANAILKSHHLPQTYELKLKSLLPFQEIENLAQATGARISRLKGRDAPWYEVTIADARRDALRNRLFQSGNPVEKIKRVKIGNVALESLPPGQHRPLSDAEVATLRKSLVDVSLVPGATAARPATAQVSGALLADTSAAAPMGPVLVAQRPERRPQVKRFFKPKPKPGQGPRTFGDRPPRSFDRPAAGTAGPRRDGPPSFGKKSFGKKSFDGPKPFRGGKSFGGDRPSGDRKPFGSDRPYGEKKSFGGNRPTGDRKPFGGDRPRASGGSFGEGRPSRPGSFGKPGGFGKKSFGADRPPREGNSFGGDRPFRGKPSFGGDRPKSFGGPSSVSGRPGTFGKPGGFGKKSFGSDRPKREGGSFGGDRPFKGKPSFGGGRSSGGKSFGGPRDQGRPAGPGGFGKPNRFGKGSKPAGSRGPKRGGPGGSRPKPGGSRGPRNSS
jgi:23S rRNA pseudouridine2605 synthase